MKSYQTSFVRVVLVLIVLFFYFWTATNGTYSFNFKKHYYIDNWHYFTSYNFLAKGFLNGQLDLSVKAPFGLSALPNPFTYHPRINELYRQNGFHDLSFYKEKLYLYFGPTPALILYLPFQFLTKLELPDNLVVFLFTFGTLIWASLILFYIKKNYFPEIPEWMVLLAVSIIVFSNVGPYLIRRPAVYEVAISSGCFFLTGSIFFLFIAFTKKHLSLLFFISSLFLGLAVGSKTNYIFAAIFILIFSLFKLVKNKISNKSSLFIMIVPFVFCILLLMLYNYLRFDNVFENGFKYQLTNYKFKLIDLSCLAPNLYSYLLQLPLFNYNFPFFYLDEWKSPSLIYRIVYFEKIVGLFPGVSFLWLSVIFPIFYLIIRSFSSKTIFDDSKVFPNFEFYIVFVTSIINLICLLFYQFVTMRFLADVAGLFIISTCILWFYFYTMFKKQFVIRLMINVIVVLLSINSIVYGFSFSITGCFNELKLQNPAEYKKLENIFKPVSKILRKKPTSFVNSSQHKPA